MLSQVSPQGLGEWIRSLGAGAPRPVVLDVREPWEVQTAHVAPSEQFDLVAIPMNLIPARLAELDPARPVACLCHHGGRSMQVAMFLAQRGFDTVANVAGGIDAWAREVDPSIPRY